MTTANLTRHVPAIREALTKATRTNTFKTVDGYTLRREIGPNGAFLWTDGDLSWPDHEGSPIEHPVVPSQSVVIPLAGQFIPDSDPTLIWVGIYFVRRLYGGPEEGGWWYEAGHHAGAEVYADIGMAPRAFLRWDDPEMGLLVGRMNDALETTANKDRGPLGSVLSKGRYQSMCHELNELPTSFSENSSYE